MISGLAKKLISEQFTIIQVENSINAKASIKALDVGVLSGFAWLDIIDLDALIFAVIFEVV